MTAEPGSDEQHHAELTRRLLRQGIELDLAKVGAVTEVNDSALHGAIVMARFPRTGPAAELADLWQGELAEITGSRVRFSSNLHLAEASLTDPPHLPWPLRRADLDGLDLGLFLRSIKDAGPFTIQFVKLYLDPDGNLVLAGQTDDDTPLGLREAWRRTGLWMKGHPPLEGARCTFHVTLTHLPLGMWESLTATAIGRLAAWLEGHVALTSRIEVEVTEFRVACMDRRSGASVLGEEIRLPLQGSSGLSSRSFHQTVLARFDALA
jgi:hypothetical protein